MSFIWCKFVEITTINIMPIAIGEEWITLTLYAMGLFIYAWAKWAN